MPLQNFFVQKSPELVWDMSVATDGTWTAAISTGSAKAGQRTELLQVGEIRLATLTVAPITNAEIYIVEAAHGGRSNVGVNIADGVYVSDSLGGGSEMNFRDSSDSPFSWLIPSTNLFGVNWCIFLEVIADGAVFCSIASAAQLAPLTIPTRKLNKPVRVVDQVLSSSQMALIPPNIITRDVGDFTTKVKPRDDVLVQGSSFNNIYGRVKTVVAGQIDLYAPHNQDTGGNVAGHMVVSQASDGT